MPTAQQNAVSEAAHHIERDVQHDPHDLKNVYSELHHLRSEDPTHFSENVRELNKQYHADLVKNGQLPDLTISDDDGHLAVTLGSSDKHSAGGSHDHMEFGPNDAAATSAGSSPTGSAAGSDASAGGSPAAGGSAVGGAGSDASAGGSPAAGGSAVGGAGSDASAGGSTGSVGALTGAIGQAPENAKAMYDFFTSHGLSPNAAAGIIGNIAQESGGNPESVGSGGNGLIGWTPPLAGAVTGDAQKDLAFQLNAVMKYIDQNGSVSAINANASSPSAAAAYFMNNYERPAVATENSAHRESAANAVAQLYA